MRKSSANAFRLNRSHWLRTVLIGMVLIFSGLLGSADNPAATARTAGMRLACLCGSCKNTVANCPMLHCHYGEPAKESVAQMVAEGKTEQQIIDAFVAKEGIRSLAEPPRSGFNLMAILMPGIALLLGLGLVILAIQRLRKVPVRAMTPKSTKVDQQALAHYKEQIDRDLAQMD